MPFGADAPYYFRSFESPVVYDFDFHKQTRNPNNKVFYDDSMSKIMRTNGKYDFVKSRVDDDSVFSHNFEMSFAQNVIDNVQSGRYVLIALYASDANSVVPIETVRAMAQDKRFLQQNLVEILFRKFLCDVIEMLNMNFDFVKYYQKNNYTYYLFQKR